MSHKPAIKYRVFFCDMDPPKSLRLKVTKLRFSIRKVFRGGPVTTERLSFCVDYGDNCDSDDGDDDDDCGDDGDDKGQG